jgi:MFS family permease
MLIAFGSYILSFALFFLARGFWWLVVPMVAFGVGEAFRSGTHKAMIMEYLDLEGITESKTKVYGFTRSYSNIGSVLSSLFGIAMVVWLPELRYLFLLAVLPYVIDAWLIWTYPKELNQRLEQRFTIRHVLQETLASIRYVFTRRPLRRVVVDAAFFSATYKTSRDFLQPLLFTAALGTILVAGADADQNARMVVGLVFVLAQFLSVFATRYAYLLGRVMRARSVLHLTWVSTGVLVLLLGWWSDSVMVVLLVLASVYVAQNLRKPYTVEAIGERTVNERRSSVLSIESQLTSIAIIVAAPILGFLADRWTLSAMFALLGGALMVSRLFFLERKTHA